MYVKTKNLYLKQGIDGKQLEDYGFITETKGKTYILNIDDKKEEYVIWIKDSRMFILYIAKTNARTLKKALKGILPKEMLEVKTTYRWVTIFGKYRDFGDKKKRKIQAKLKRLNGEA